MKPRHIFLSLMIAIVLSQFLPNLAYAQSFDWKKFSGATLRVVIFQGPWIDSQKAQIAKFEEATGIKLNVEILPEQQAREKLKVEMQAKNDTLDAFMNQTSTMGAEYAQNGWSEPLDAYIADTTKTSPDFDYDKDFLSYSKDAVKFNGKTHAIPTDRVLGPILFYRKDLLDQYKVEVPKTLAELETAAKKVYEASSKSVTGIVNRGKGAQATSQFAPVMHEFGGKWQDEQGNPTINTPEWIAAAEWWGRTMRETGNQGATAFAFAETVNEFLSGKAAFTLEGGVNPGNINDEKQSQIKGKVGYAPIPRGTAPESVRTTEPCRVTPPFGLGISAFSKQKDAAWYFVQWFAGKAAGLDYLKAGRMAARQSAWDNPEFKASIENSPDKGYWDAMAIASKICYPSFGFAPAAIKDQNRARDIIGEVIVTSITGGDVKAAAAQAQQELETLKARQ
ncbi:MAG: sugar ABC transporter substrate-binding protein [Anaerolineae bacterium]|nr:sugar ABC transporter substrate-binding protein [Anaerolineae bacterium]